MLHPDLETNGITVKLQSLYKFIHQTVSTLSKAREHLNEDDHSHVPLFGTSSSSSSSSSDGARGSRIGYGLMSPPEIALRFFLMAAKSADETGFEELAYEFFVQVNMVCVS